MKRNAALSQLGRVLAVDCTWTDINCHYCHYCHEPLAMFEFVRCATEEPLVETCRQHTANVATQRIAHLLGIPLFKVAYTGTPLELAVLMQVGHPQTVVLKPDTLAYLIDQLHNCELCRGFREGRFKDQ